MGARLDDVQDFFIYLTITLVIIAIQRQTENARINLLFLI